MTEVLGMSWGLRNEADKEYKDEVLYLQNIEKDLFQQKKGDQNFVIHLPRGKKTNKIHKTYSDVNESEVVLLFNSSNLLEVAINRADKNAVSGGSTLLGIKEGDQIIINFLKKNN